MKDSTLKLINRIILSPETYTGVGNELNRSLLNKALLEEDEKYKTDMYYVDKLGQPLSLEDIKDVNMQSLLLNKVIGVKPRGYLEYNPRYEQLIAGVIIQTSDDYILTLTPKNEEGRINKVSLVQGHMDFSVLHMTKTLSETIVHEAKRELFEETTINDEIIDSIVSSNDNAVEFITVKTTNNLVSLEHVGFFMHLKTQVSYEDIQGYGINSGEPNKHEVVFVPLNDLKENKYDIDDWFETIINKIL